MEGQGLAFLEKLGYLEKAFRSNARLAGALRGYIARKFEEIRAREGRDYRIKIMDFCGTHEWTIVHFGLRSLMPEGVELVAGPGCPVCVTPSWYIERAIELSLSGVTVYTYGDTFKLRAVNPVDGVSSLEEARAAGGRVRLVVSLVDAVRDASRHGGESVFLGIGFETVAPGYARAVVSGSLPENLKLMSLVKLTPPAMFYSLDILRDKPTEPPVMGVIAPGHVSTVTGAKAWEPVAEQFQVPVVVSGFEPIDVLMGIAEIMRQLARGEYGVKVEYTRAVTWEGDLEAQAAIHEAFEAVDDAWRGIGFLPLSGLRLREKYGRLDALRHFGIEELTPEKWRKDTPPGCRCAEVTLGKAKPTDCPMFMKKCTPEKPYGPCMVSLEGTCAVWARFGGGGLADQIARDLALEAGLG
ncbi:hydrogenase formation protein HypD [Thermofilum pendens]|uniref:Hydrogenase formation HypD protein n=1 Tax=Thermofilum pendens (strain DSM 2475 / Hrk 5) TaxID=368408 RepID=A1S0N0_THEPD|nr:hydrogenase formation protein HypD [Thermofilum pendens]ABL79010.1 hydrogenase formation HypD protein [Thermofilum pendens Hrk 5]